MQKGPQVSNPARIKSIAALGVLIVVALIVVPRQCVQSPRQPDPTSAEAATVLEPIERAKPASDPGPTLRTAASGEPAELFVVAADTMAPLLARCSAMSAEAPTAHIGVMVTCATTADGGVALDSLPDANQLLIHAPGFISSAIDKPQAAARVALQRGATLQVYVVAEDGNPCVDAEIYATPWIHHRELASPQWLGAGIGDPRSKRPTWCARTDDSGIASMDTLPPGSYALRILHSSSVPQGLQAWAEAPVTAPGIHQFAMLDLYAVVAIALPPRQVLQHTFIMPAGIDMDPVIARSRHTAQRSLQERFPNAVAYVGRPTRPGARDVMIGVRAMLTGNVAAEIDWPLARIREILDPVVLEPDESKLFRAVTCRVQSPAGVPFDMRLRWQLMTTEGKRPAPRFGQSGDSILLAPGTYRVFPEAVPRWVNDQFAQSEVVIRETDPLHVEKVITFNKFLRMVRVHLVPPEGAARDGAFVGVLISAAGDSYGVMNWNAARGPIECLLPSGRAELTVQGLLSADPVSIEVTESAEPLDVRLLLRERSATENGSRRPAAGPATGK